MDVVKGEQRGAAGYLLSLSCFSAPPGPHSHKLFPDYLSSWLQTRG